jgi:uncharacterized membrane protein
VTPLVKKLSWALAASLALNLFGLGYLAARSLRHHRPPHHARFEGTEPGRPARHLFGPHIKELRTHHRHLKEARKQVAEALAAEPYDRTALDSALTRLRDVTAEGQRKLHQVLLDRAQELPLAERKKLAHGRFFRKLAPGP